MKIVDFSVTANVANNRPMSWMVNTTRISHWDTWTRVYKNVETGKCIVYFHIKWGTAYVIKDI